MRIGNYDNPFLEVARQLREKFCMGLMPQPCPTSSAERGHPNLVGPQIRRLRTARGWSQSKLAMRLQLNGLDISRTVLAQMESQLHCIKDKDIPYFARALRADLTDIFIGFGR